MSGHELPSGKLAFPQGTILIPGENEFTLPQGAT